MGRLARHYLDVKEILESVAHHREQSEPNYCVPACACIVLSRLGRQMRQDEICADWHGSGRGYALQDAAPLLGGRYLQLDPQEPRNIDWLHVQLQSSRWIIAYVFAAEMGQVVRAMLRGRISLLRPLWPGESGRLHAVVLTGAVDQQFYVLDPLYPAPGQPLPISREDLAQALQGSVLVVDVG